MVERSVLRKPQGERVRAKLLEPAGVEVEEERILVRRRVVVTVDVADSYHAQSRRRSRHRGPEKVVTQFRPLLDSEGPQRRAGKRLRRTSWREARRG